MPCRSTGWPPRSITIRRCRRTFTPREQLRRNGFDRLIRLGIGLEDADDLIAALNWTLHHADAMNPAAVTAWQDAREASLLGDPSR